MWISYHISASLITQWKAIHDDEFKIKCWKRSVIFCYRLTIEFKTINNRKPEKKQKQTKTKSKLKKWKQPTISWLLNSKLNRVKLSGYLATNNQNEKQKATRTSRRKLSGSKWIIISKLACIPKSILYFKKSNKCVIC